MIRGHDLPAIRYAGGATTDPGPENTDGPAFVKMSATSGRIATTPWGPRDPHHIAKTHLTTDTDRLPTDTDQLTEATTGTTMMKLRGLSKSSGTSRSRTATRRRRRFLLSFNGRVTRSTRETWRPRCIVLGNLEDAVFDRTGDSRRWQRRVDDGSMHLGPMAWPRPRGGLRRRALLRDSSSWQSLRRLRNELATSMRRIWP